MKKYKLIKEYPSSVKLGTIITDSGCEIFFKKYPDFWKEIKEDKIPDLNPSHKGYYLLTIPVLSINDILEIQGSIRGDYMHDMENLVKSKI